MKQPLIQTEKYLLLVSKEKPKLGEFYYCQDRDGYDQIFCRAEVDSDAERGKTILAHLPLTKESPILEGVYLLPFVVNPYDELILKQLDFIHEAVRNADFDLGFKTGALAMCMKNEKQPKFFTAEIEEYEEWEGMFFRRLYRAKTTTNSQGQKVLVGSYSVK